MNGKALERDVSTHTNNKYHNAWIDRVVSDQTNDTTPKPLRIYPSQIATNIIYPLEKKAHTELSVCFVKEHKSNSWV